jgi:SAM-dependent methyltransferase
MRRLGRRLPGPVKRGVRQLERRVADLPGIRTSRNSVYWHRANVTRHRRYATREESLAHLRWRNDQYLFYEELIPFDELDGLTVLDFGCGPGHDLVALAEFSRAQRIIGADVSPASLAEAKARMQFHRPDMVELLRTSDVDSHIPLPDASVDFIVSSGVLHHCPNIGEILVELRRVLKPDGRIRIMVYNRDSVFVHLHVAYLRQVVGGIDREMTLEDAFRRSTDGEGCPYSVCYTPDEFAGLATAASFHCTSLGAAVSTIEMAELARRFDAIQDERLAAEHRAFLRELTFDGSHRPLHNGDVAGVDGFFELRPSAAYQRSSD